MLYRSHEEVRTRMNSIVGIVSDLFIENQRYGTYKKEYEIADKEYRALLAIYNVPDCQLTKNPIEIPRMEDGKGKFAKKVRDWFNRPRVLSPLMSTIGFLHPI